MKRVVLEMPGEVHRAALRIALKSGVSVERVVSAYSAASKGCNVGISARALPGVVDNLSMSVCDEVTSCR